MIIDYVQQHQAQFWFATGFVLMGMEVLLFGFSTIVLLFAGIGALATGLLMLLGVLPETWIAGISCFGLVSGVCGVLLWKPLQNMQHADKPNAGHSSDFIGLEFVLDSDISPSQPGTHSYSGVRWRVEPDPVSDADSIGAGSRVRVVSLDAGVFRVVPVD